MGKQIEGNGVPEDFRSLSPREHQILHLYSQGRCVKEIAADLGIRYHSVGTYKKRIMQKLQIKNHNQFLVAAIKNSFALQADKDSKPPAAGKKRG